MILDGEITDSKMSSFSTDFQTLIKHVFYLWIQIDLFEVLLIGIGAERNS